MGCGFRAHIASTWLGKAADPHLPSWPCGYICRAKVRRLGGSVKFISAYHHFWVNLPSIQGGNKPCPSLAQGWEWNAHIYFSFCSPQHKGLVSAQEKKSGGTEKELSTSFHPPVSTLVLRSAWRSSLQNGSAVPLQGLHVFPSVLPCCTRRAPRLSLNGKGCKGRRTVLHPAPTAFISPQEYLQGEEVWTLQWDHDLNVTLQHIQDHSLAFVEHNLDKKLRGFFCVTKSKQQK